MAKSAEPRVVAELGRPETPEETAARKAEQSRLYRDRKTLRNLLYALLVCVALVAAIIFIVPRNDSSMLQDVDYRQVAASAQSSMPVPLAVPDLPEGWSSNAAELRTATTDDVTSWYIGLISPEKEYVGVTQALDANPSWVSQQVAEGIPSGATDIDGVRWTIYDNRSGASGNDDVGNVEYALTTEAGRSTYIVFGTAEAGEIEAVAASLSQNVLAQGDIPATGDSGGE
ncbi:DUF4245 domain-containing protein [Herbiconiux daphne]|uniref:DUF4245 domain-containing protein n=1 Tax=Herbiconiux daphne TaxID=2970914 RepID=A0ABT2H2R2_9MICO|nr:DUF4245 domain-containing protein [Herbiconiux daphne]MCS5734238.1 DUF4245 domain-containing protein [Herbiconiux daphne]